jgi:hypothetical protein
LLSGNALLLCFLLTFFFDLALFFGFKLLLFFLRTLLLKLSNTLLLRFGFFLQTLLFYFRALL